MNHFEPLLKGEGAFTDNTAPEGALHMAIVGSPVAHGRLLDCDVSEASAMPGVRLVLTAQDLAREGVQPLTHAPTFESVDGTGVLTPERPILADGKLIVAGGGFEHRLGAQPGYECCSGRGFVAAFKPEDGTLLWKYEVGPEPQKLDPPVAIPIDDDEICSASY